MSGLSSISARAPQRRRLLSAASFLVLAASAGAATAQTASATDPNAPLPQPGAPSPATIPGTSVAPSGQDTGQTVGPVSSQTQNNSVVNEVVVTGTQIRGVAPVGSPVISIGQQAIEQTGLTTTAAILHSIPQVTGIGPGESTTGTNANNASLNNTFANAIDLRGLGVQATLTLLDGRRVPPGGVGSQLFDPSSIPTIALSRIDVVADGASAIYGSDAVAGVANLILRKNFDGVELDANYGFASDYYQKQFDAIAGKRWNGGSLMLAGEYSWHSHLMESDRPNLFQCNEKPFGGTNNCSFDATPGNVVNPANGARFGLPGGSGVGLTPAQLLATANTIQSSANQDSIPQLERYSIVGSLTQKVTDRIGFWAEGYYTNRRFNENQPAATIDSGTPVPSSNPYFVSFYPGQTSETVQYSLLKDLGEQTRTGSERAYQGAGGFDIDLGHSFRLALYGQNSEDTDVDYTENQINRSALNTALAGATTATAFNPYGSGGSASNVAIANTFRAADDIGSRFEQNLGNVKLDGDLFQLPGGAVKIALGGEYRHESLLDTEVGNASTPNPTEEKQIANTTNTRSVASAFGELFIPLVGSGNALPFVQRLEFDVAGRFDHYSDVGNTSNPKIGLRWDPVHDFTIHGTYGTSFRAPTLADLNPDSTATVFTVPNFGPGGNVVEYVGGNPDLKPETATTYSIGGDYRPSWLHGLHGSINYYHIDYKNIIDTPALFNIAVFTQPQLYSSFVTHNPTPAQLQAIFNLPFAPPPTLAFSQINNLVDGRRHNVGEAITSGLDLALDYAWDSPYGKWNVGGTGTYVLDYDYSLVPGAPFIDRVNQTNYPLRFRARFQTGWNLNGFGVNVFVNYSNPYDNTVGTIAPSQHVAAYTTVDASFIYNTGDNPAFGGVYAKNLIFSLNIQNLLDKDPPFAVVAVNQEYDSQVANPIGRLISFDLKKRF